MSQNITSILNDLIETSKDGEEGFRAAAEDSKNAELHAMFLRCAGDCASGVAELQQLVTRRGDEPEDSGTVAGAVHRGWVNLKAAISGRTALRTGRCPVRRRPRPARAWETRSEHRADRTAWKSGRCWKTAHPDVRGRPPLRASAAGWQATATAERACSISEHVLDRARLARNETHACVAGVTVTKRYPVSRSH